MMLDKTGYLHIKNYFDPETICIEADKTVKISQKIKWNYIKVYHNIFIHKFINSLFHIVIDVIIRARNFSMINNHITI